jgi:hypothetical protein
MVIAHSVHWTSRLCVDVCGCVGGSGSFVLQLEEDVDGLSFGKGVYRSPCFRCVCARLVGTSLRLLLACALPWEVVVGGASTDALCPAWSRGCGGGCCGVVWCVSGFGRSKVDFLSNVEVGLLLQKFCKNKGSNECVGSAPPPFDTHTTTAAAAARHTPALPPPPSTPA